MGEAALLSAKTGQDYLKIMRGQMDIANEWAATDRERQQDVFIPLEDEYIKEAQNWDNPGRIAQRVSEARSDAQLQGQLAEEGAKRQAMAMGVNPGSGRFLAGSRAAKMNTGLARLGAGNTARRMVRAEADQREANAINLGKGLAVNPGTSLGLANGAASSGYQGAMQGYGQQANILGQEFDQRMSKWQADQSSSAGLWGAIGTVAGMMPMLSDEDAKTDKKKPGRSLLKAVEDMPVEEWSYKDGRGDGGRHVGTYAQDFQRATGVGDGRTINVVDAIGTTMGAIKELSKKVDKLQGRRIAA
ncbi:tail fiber domain-containing protein [Paracoccus sp. M683]|uniref:tail fiber domain-containing protein n=1 Tax=Paracoccus sp. M683 TaxID=2594268 RepID=UPI00163DBB59|nr:tail fiber domain-containing protein [Paracoccus sp. M683]